MVLEKVVEQSKKHLRFVKEMVEVMNAENREEALHVFMRERRKSETLGLQSEEGGESL